MRSLFFLLFFFPSLQIHADTSRLLPAIELDDVRSVRKIIESGEASVDERIVAPPYSTPSMPIIMVAARAGSEKVVDYLISAKANLNATAPNGDSALMLAVFFDDSYLGGNGGIAAHDRIAKKLVQAGAHPNQGRGYQALAYAAYKDRTAIGKYLIENGAWINGYLEDGVSLANTPLMMASMTGHKAFVLLLLRAGADASLSNHMGNTALSLAQKYNQKHLVPFIQCALRLKPGEKFQEICE